MRIRTFQNADGKGKYADLIDWRTVPGVSKSDQKKTSQKTAYASKSKKPKHSGISYNEEESE